jgi:hypothetical protein
MAYIRRDDRNQARSGALGHAVYGYFELTLDHLIDFFLRMEVLVNGRAALEVVVRECHARGVEIAAIPARQALYDIEAAGIDEGHAISPLKNLTRLDPSPAFFSIPEQNADRSIRRSVAITAPEPVAAQTTGAKRTTKASKTWTAPRTADGHPDLQGFWTNATLIPLERPVELGNKEFYTEAESAAMDKERVQRENSQANFSKVTSRRTSLIFDPPDGRVPPFMRRGPKARCRGKRRRAPPRSGRKRAEPQLG